MVAAIRLASASRGPVRPAACCVATEAGGRPPCPAHRRAGAADRPGLSSSGSRTPPRTGRRWWPGRRGAAPRPSRRRCPANVTCTLLQRRDSSLSCASPRLCGRPRCQAPRLRGSSHSRVDPSHRNAGTGPASNQPDQRLRGVHRHAHQGRRTRRRKPAPHQSGGDLARSNRLHRSRTRRPRAGQRYPLKISQG